MKIRSVVCFSRRRSVRLRYSFLVDISSFSCTVPCHFLDVIPVPLIMCMILFCWHFFTLTSAILLAYVTRHPDTLFSLAPLARYHLCSSCPCPSCFDPSWSSSCDHVCFTLELSDPPIFGQELRDRGEDGNDVCASSRNVSEQFLDGQTVTATLARFWSPPILANQRWPVVIRG